MTELLARLDWPLRYPLSLRATLFGMAFLIAAIAIVGVGPGGVPFVVRNGAAAFALTGIALHYLLASRRPDFGPQYRRAHRLIGSGFVLSALALSMMAASGREFASPVAATINVSGYMLALVGVLLMPARALARLDRWLLASDVLTMVVGMAALAGLMAREGVFASAIGRQAAPATLFSLTAVLATLSALALRGEPIPSIRAIRWTVNALGILFAALLCALLYAAGVLDDRRLIDLLYFAFLTVELVVSYVFFRLPVEAQAPQPAAATRFLVRLGPVATVLLICLLTLFSWCLMRGADRSALIALVGVMAVAVPTVGRLQLWQWRREAAREQQVAERTARLDAMGRLAGGFAHELNNTLTTLLNAATLARLAPDEATRHRDLDELSEAATRAARLARLTLVASGRALPQLAPQRLPPIVTEAGRIAAAELAPRWQLALAPPPVLQVHTDAEQLRELIRLMTRIIRGSQPDGGALSLTVDTAVLAHTVESAAAAVGPGRVVQITVVDAPGERVGDALPDAAILFERDVTGDPALAFDLTVARGLALALGAGLQLHARRGLGARARLLLPLT